MANRRKIPAVSTLLYWRDIGLTHQQMADRIAEETGEHVTRSSVSVALHRAGKTREANRWNEYVPWRVPERFAQTHPLRMLRALARSRAGMTLKPDTAYDLELWQKRLNRDEVIVAYDPETGAHYVPATMKDHTGLAPIRITPTPRGAHS